MTTRRSGIALKTFCVSLALLTGTTAQATYWNLFNIERESISAQYITYASLDDMLNDTNRVGSFLPNAGEAGANIVDGGFTSSAVPEPSSWATLTVGFAMLGGALRRRKAAKKSSLLIGR